MFQRRPIPGHAALALALASAAASALYPATALAQGERESLVAVRETTLALIELLVENGTLSREKADAMLAQARARAAEALAQAPQPETPVVRVPYVPQVVRDQIRSEIKEEVLAQAKIERWGVPNATAEWTDRISISGDLRLRAQRDRPGSNNLSPQDFLVASLSGTTRAADFATGTATGLPTGSTQDDLDRMRLRARLGINAKISTTVTAGLRLATGSSSDRVSTNQTLGQNFNKYQFLLDRAFVKLDPVEWASVSAGRFANPWFSTDLVWSDNLNFEGVSANVKWPQDAAATWRPYATLGYFPVRQSSGAVRSRAILGAQVGAQWEPSERTRAKFGLAQYSFNNFAGQIDPAYDAISGPQRGYGQYQYEAGLRQRGNTLFLTNNPQELAAGLTPDKALWGQASKFRPLALTAAVEFSHFAPTVVSLSGEFVRNTAFDRQEIFKRTGVQVSDAHANGYGVRGTIGAQQVRYAGDWQLSLGYRWLGSDAVPDAFVDSDLGGGGTNVRGVTAAVVYGIARDTQLGLRLLSGRTISSPTLQPGQKDGYSIFSWQVDLNVSF